MPIVAWSGRILASGFLPVLMVTTTLGLNACAKKPSVDRSRPADQAPKSDDKQKRPALPGAIEPKTLDSPLRPRVMESPVPTDDAGTARPRDNKGMIAQMKLVDPTE